MHRDGHRDRHDAVPEPTGRRGSWDGREWLVHTRDVAATVDAVWTALTDPVELARWVGTWRPGPGGTIEFLMVFEGDDALPVTYRVDACETGRRLAVSMSEDGPAEPTHVVVQLIPVEVGPRGVRLILTHSVTNLALAPHLATGCEYYLDRLVRLVETGDAELPESGHLTLDAMDFDEYFLAQAPHYRRLFPLQRKGTGGS